jgi:hypothetical protein
MLIYAILRYYKTIYDYLPSDEDLLNEIKLKGLSSFYDIMVNIVKN